VTMDVMMAAGASVCARVTATGNLADDPGILSLLRDPDGGATVANGFETSQASGEWMRLYLIDAPAGSSLRILAVAIIAPESTFERAVEEAVPVVNSIEFHAR